jgi:GMP synthase (glutamine-hydrolysing)
MPLNAADTTVMLQPILIVLHQEHSTPGRVGNALRQLGYPLDVRRPRFDDPLPQTMAEHAAAIIFGGPMSANDDTDFIRREIEWIAVPLKENKPFLGICLGAQMFAHHLGARVFRHPEGHAEIGYYPIRPTAAGLALVPQWPECVYHERAYALQFHPDVTHAMMHRWTTTGHERMQLPGARPRETHFADRAVYDYTARAWLSVFLERWMS